ncbi:hypothetical protein ACLOJK_021172 [Asimina triloba]
MQVLPLLGEQASAITESHHELRVVHEKSPSSTFDGVHARTNGRKKALLLLVTVAGHRLSDDQLRSLDPRRRSNSSHLSSAVDRGKNCQRKTHSIFSGASEHLVPFSPAKPNHRAYNTIAAAFSSIASENPSPLPLLPANHLVVTPLRPWGKTHMLLEAAPRRKPITIRRTWHGRCQPSEQIPVTTKTGRPPTRAISGGKPTSSIRHQCCSNRQPLLLIPSIKPRSDVAVQPQRGRRRLFPRSDEKKKIQRSGPSSHREKNTAVNPSSLFPARKT